MKTKILLLSFFLLLFSIHPLKAGPPFITDDPEPVGYKHWEFYVSSVNTYQPNHIEGTLPHFETNFGLLPNLQIHLLIPFNFTARFPGFNYNYSTTEFGAKYRIIQENANIPQVGVFPIVEIPTIRNKNNNWHLFFPLWIQKSFGNFTTYGGGGYWINTGKEELNQLFLGWEIQHEFSDFFTTGCEIFYQSADQPHTRPLTGANLGGLIRLTSHLQLIFSAGHAFNQNQFLSYVGLLGTI